MTQRGEPPRCAPYRAVLAGAVLAVVMLVSLVPRAGAQEPTGTTLVRGAATVVTLVDDTSGTTATTAPAAEEAPDGTGSTTTAPTTTSASATTATTEPPPSSTTTAPAEEAPAAAPTTSTTAAAVAGQAATTTSSSTSTTSTSTTATTTERHPRDRVAAQATGLSISVPGGSVSLGAIDAGTASVSGRLGAVTVTDQRLILSSWTAGVSVTDFVTGGGSTAERIGRGAVTYAAGAPTGVAGVSLFVGTPGAVLDQARTAASGTTILLGGSATWNPTITVAIPAGKVTGTYTATVTHSVA